MVQVAVVFVVVVDVSKTSAGFSIDCVEAGLLIAQSIDCVVAVDVGALMFTFTLTEVGVVATRGEAETEVVEITGLNKGAPCNSDASDDVALFVFVLAGDVTGASLHGALSRW